MKLWFSNKLLSLKHIGAYLRALLNVWIGVLYICLVLLWLVTPYVHIGHLLLTVAIVACISTLSFKQGVQCERVWTTKHPTR